MRGVLWLDLAAKFQFDSKQSRLAFA
jgi:hypothetical protein